METLVRLTLAAVVTVGAGVFTLKIMEILGIGSLIFALALNQILPMWILFVFTVTGPDLTRPWLEFYFKPRGWERDGKFWLRLGVLRFQALLFSFKSYRSFLNQTRAQQYPAGQQSASNTSKQTDPNQFRSKSEFHVRKDAAFFRHMECQTRNAETAHGICFLIVVGFAIYAATVGSVWGVVWLLAVGIFTQVYPMFLQRYHRPRWRRMISRVSGAAPISDPPASAAENAITA